MTSSIGFIAQEIPDWHGGQQITISNTKPNHSVVFHNAAQKKVGELDFNGPQLEFTGDASASAQVFIYYIANEFRQRLSDERDRLIKDIEELGFATDEQRQTAQIILHVLKSKYPPR
jgi:hypothetical protein